MVARAPRARVGRPRQTSQIGSGCIGHGAHQYILRRQRRRPGASPLLAQGTQRPDAVALPLRSVLVLGIALATVVSINPVGDLWTYQDWIVGCDNRHACHATTLDPASTPYEIETGADPIADNAVGMALERGGGADDTARLRLLACYQCDRQESPDPVAVRSLTVLDKTERPIFRQLISAPQASLAASPGGLALGGDPALFAALAQGETLALADQAGARLADISLRGLRDVLIRMDADQDRIGVVSALLMQGPAPAFVSRPRRIDAPIIVPPISHRAPTRLSAARLHRLQEKHRCDDPDAGAPEAAYARLDQHSTLLLLNAACAPYNSQGYAYIIDNRRRARPASLRITPDPSPLETPWLVSASWDARERRLESFGRGRAMADCGQQQEFAWTGTQFLLVEEMDMGACRGSIDYITVYRRRTLVRKAAVR